MTGLRVALVGDFDSSVTAHRSIPEALRLAGGVEGVWVPTESISDPTLQLRDFDGVWCVPASPYASMEGALGAIRLARESGRPFLGTCGGFQHALIEYARSVCGLSEAAHAETDPGAASPLISPLACSLVERRDPISLREGTRIRKAYGVSSIDEEYHCRYGLNREYEGRLFGGDLRPTAHDVSGEVRAVELEGHPFFVAVLFQPERRALRGEVPPLVKAFTGALGA